VVRETLLESAGVLPVEKGIKKKDDEEAKSKPVRLKIYRNGKHAPKYAERHHANGSHHSESPRSSVGFGWSQYFWFWITGVHRGSLLFLAHNQRQNTPPTTD
jgi:hypothetical protein